MRIALETCDMLVDKKESGDLLTQKDAPTIQYYEIYTKIGIGFTRLEMKVGPKQTKERDATLSPVSFFRNQLLFSSTSLQISCFFIKRI